MKQSQYIKIRFRLGYFVTPARHRDTRDSQKAVRVSAKYFSSWGRLGVSTTYFHSYLSYCPVGAGGSDSCHCCPQLVQAAPVSAQLAPLTPLYDHLQHHHHHHHPHHHPPQAALVPLHQQQQLQQQQQHRLPSAAAAAAAAICELHAPKAAHFLAPSMVRILCLWTFWDFYPDICRVF